MKNIKKCLFCINKFHVPNYLKKEYLELGLNPGLACCVKRINIEENSYCEQFKEQTFEELEE